MQGEAKWYVRGADGRVFGPVVMDVLKGWARDGRVEPSAGISGDLVNWTPAPRVPELEMDRIVENEPGQFYGPTHRAVAEDLLKSGSLAPGARVFLDERGGRDELVESLKKSIAEKTAETVEARSSLSARDEEIARLNSSLSELSGELGKARELSTARGAEIEKLNDDLAECGSRVAAKDAELADCRRLLGEKDAALRAADSQLNARASELVATDSLLAEKDAALSEKTLLLAARAAAVRELEAKLAKAAVDVRERDARIAAMERTLREGAERLSAHEAESAALSEQIAKMSEELAEKAREIERLNAERQRGQDAAPVEPEVVVPEVIVSDAPPPAAARQAFGKASALAELERQAQRELAQMGASGARRFFKFGK